MKRRQQICNVQMSQRMRSYRQLFKITDQFVRKYTKSQRLGVLKPANQETLQEFRVLFYMSATDCEKDPVLIEKECNDCFELVKQREIRKKCIFLNTHSNVYCLGGYLFDPIKKIREAPKKDWKYTIRSKTMENIDAVPDGRINFGCAACLGKIFVITGMSFNNVPLSTCYRYDIYEDRWEKLPNLESAPSWAGVSVTDKLECIVIGGYSLRGGRPYSSPECYLLRYGALKWQKLPNLPSPTANAMSATDGDTVYAMGGREIRPDGPGSSIPEIYSLTPITAFKDKKIKWIHVTSIPEYDIKNTNIVYETDKIFTTDRPTPSKDPEIATDEPKTKFTYSFKNDKWYEGRKEIKDSDDRSSKSGKSSDTSTAKSSRTSSDKESKENAKKSGRKTKNETRKNEKKKGKKGAKKK